MTVKDFFGKCFSRYLWSHLLAMAVVDVVLCMGVKYGLDIYTHHGEGIVVPNVKGMSYDKAYSLLTSDGLAIVVSDSGYNKRQPALSILAQNPGYGTKVKAGHIVYVTVNSPSSPTVSIPDIVDNSSLREAEARLTAMGFRMLPPQFTAGEKDWVYGILCHGHRVSTGDRVSIESPLTLVVGDGTFDETSDEINYTDAPATELYHGATEGADIDDFEEVKEY